jgi:hypothetical protein
MIRETKLFPSLMRKTLFAFSIIVMSAASSTDASVSYALSLDDVARESALVVRIMPVDQTTAWEDGRIVTTTNARIESFLAGTPSTSSSNLRIRTLGGVVGDVGQRVEGEAHFVVGTPSIVFLMAKTGENRFFVSGRAQGQLVIVNEGAGAAAADEVVRIRGTDTLLTRSVRVPLAPVKGTLVVSLEGKRASEVIAEVTKAWELTHAQ